MRSIDVHAHLVPKRCLDAFQAGNDWHGVTLGKDDKGINHHKQPLAAVAP